MLVLSRKVGEKILIGDCITVTIVRVAPGVVRLGVDAPRNMTVVREELLGAKPRTDQENENTDQEHPEIEASKSQD